jgi:hypothetical protein
MVVCYLTLLHLLAVRPIKAPKYSLVVLACTVSSVAWHLNEHSNILFLLDHALACVWGLSDTILDRRTLWFNVPVCILDAILPHTLWHVLSAMKAVVVSHRFVGKNIKFRL